MKVFRFYMPERQRERLEELSSQKGVSLSEIVRRIIDEYLDGLERKEKQEKAKRPNQSRRKR